MSSVGQIKKDLEKLQLINRFSVIMTLFKKLIYELSSFINKFLKTK